MEELFAKLKGLFVQLIAWVKANQKIVIAIVAIAAAIFVLPKLYRKFFKRRTRTRRRRYAVSRPSLRRSSSAGRGKGSEYMRRKMARLRSMRRRKRK